jgi:HNH endonuclease
VALTPAQRVLARTVPFVDCLIYVGNPSMRYGRIGIGGGRYRGAHVVVWEDHNGRPVPPGHVIDHLCVTPRCVNVDHLRPLTPAQNTARMIRHRFRDRRVCGRGHSLEDAYRRQNGHGRTCRTCERARVRAAYYAAKGA